MTVLIHAAPAMFTPLLKMDSHKHVQLGQPIVLYCELSDPMVPVHWSKDGAELNTKNGFLVQSVGNMRRIIIESAEFLHSGAYSCDSGDDVITFNIEVKGELKVIPHRVFLVLVLIGCHTKLPSTQPVRFPALCPLMISRNRIFP